MSSSIKYSVAAFAGVAVAIVIVHRCKKKSTPSKATGVSIRVSHLIFYPIKGCMGVQRYSVECSGNGIHLDRLYAFIVPDVHTPGLWKALSQTKYPKLALIEPFNVTETNISIKIPDSTPMTHLAQTAGKEYHIDFYGKEVKAVDQGDAVSDAVSKYLGTDVRFVRIQTSGTRLFYRTPILLMSSESIAELSNRVGERVGFDRFRPNIVVSGFKPFEEDDIDHIQIGSLKLTKSELCERCSIPAVNPETGNLETKLLRRMRDARSASTMSQPNLRKGQYYLGVYYVPVIEEGSHGRVFVGQSVDRF